MAEKVGTKAATTAAKKPSGRKPKAVVESSMTEEEAVKELDAAVEEVVAEQEAVADKQEEQDKITEEKTEEIKQVVEAMEELHDSSIALNAEMNIDPMKADELVQKELEHIEEVEKKIKKKSFNNNTINSWNGMIF